MYVLGALIMVGAGVAFGALGALMIWGGMQAVRDELLRGFVSANPSGGDRALTLTLVGFPMVVAGIFGLLSAVWMVLVAIG